MRYKILIVLCVSFLFIINGFGIKAYPISLIIYEVSSIIMILISLKMKLKYLKKYHNGQNVLKLQHQDWNHTEYQFIFMNYHLSFIHTGTWVKMMFQKDLLKKIIQLKMKKLFF